MKKSIEFNWSIKMEFDDGDDMTFFQPVMAAMETISALPKVLTGKTLAEGEKELIERALLDCDGRVALAAKIVGVTRSTLYQKMKLYNIDRKELLAG